MQRTTTFTHHTPIPLTGQHTSMIESAMRFPIEAIIESKDPVESIIEFKELLSGDAGDEKEKSQGFLEIKKILSLPNPQNRPSSPGGYFALNTQESKKPVTREAVVTYIKSLMIDKMNQLIAEHFQSQDERKKELSDKSWIAKERQEGYAFEQGSDERLGYLKLENGYRFVKYQSADKSFGYIVDPKGKIVNFNLVSNITKDGSSLGTNLDEKEGDPCEFLGKTLVQLRNHPPQTSHWSLLKEMKSVIKNSQDLMTIFKQFKQNQPAQVANFCNYFLGEKDLARLIKNYDDCKRVFDTLSPPVSSYVLDMTQYKLNNFVEDIFRKNDIELLTKLLQEKKLSPNYSDPNGNTLTHLAILHQRPEIMKLLIEQKLNLDKKNIEGQTALSLAVQAKQLTAVRSLVESKANLDLPDAQGNTPLMMTIQSGQFDMTQLLVELKSNIEIKEEKTGRFPLHIAAQYDQVSIFDKLISFNADLDVRDGQGDSPLCIAAKAGSINIVKYCIERKKDLTTTDGQGNTLAQIAVINNQPQILTWLAEQGADLTVKTKDGLTLAQIAVRNGNVEILKILSEFKVGLQPNDPQAIALVKAAVQNGQPENLKILHDIGVNFQAAEGKDKDLIQIALENHQSAYQSYLNSDVFRDRDQLKYNYDNNSEVLKFLITINKNYDFEKSMRHFEFAYKHHVVESYDKNWRFIALLLLTMKKPNEMKPKTLFENYPLNNFLENREKLTTTCIEQIKLMDYEQRNKFVNEALNGDNLFNLILTTRHKTSSKLKGYFFGGETEKIKQFKLSFPLLISSEENKLDLKSELSLDEHNVKSKLLVENSSDEFKLNTIVSDDKLDRFVPDRLQDTLLQMGVKPKLIIELQDVISPSGWANIERKCSFEKINSYDQAWMLCCISGEPPAIQYGLSDWRRREKNNESPLYLACFGGNSQGINFLLHEKGYNPNYCKSNTGITALALVVNNEDLELTKLFVEKYKVETKDQELCAANNGVTPLHFAASKGNVPIMAYLISKGMQTNWMASNGSTPLHLATENGKIEAMQFLIEQKANVNQLNRSDEAPLHLAIKNNSFEDVKFLLEHGAHVDDKALEYARKFSSHEAKREVKSSQEQQLPMPSILTLLESHPRTNLQIRNR